MQTNSILIKGCAVGIIFLFIGTAIIPSSAQKIEKPSSRGNWLYVGGSGPGNYSMIQDAINASSDGDTVFVYDDSSPYYENIFMNKEIKVIGEDRNSTTIDARQLSYVVAINANNSSIEQFTLRNTSAENEIAVRIGTFHDVLVKNNIIKDSGVGIYSDGSYCEFSYNFMQIKSVGIESLFTSNLYIHHNTIQGAAFYGLRLGAKNCRIAYNVFNDSYEGIDFDFCFRNKIYENTFMNNFEGVYLQDSPCNFFYHNSFMANNNSALFLATIFFMPVYNRWVGNYWDDIGAFHIKRIPGYTFVFLGTGSLLVNRSNFDWRPAKEPYGH
jgi:parallel beta-helix repeat protein